MPGEAPDSGSTSPEANSTPAFVRLGLRTPAGWVPLPAENPLPPPSIPDYTLLRRIGGGAYGEVWLARNFTGSHFAIKVVHRCLFDHDRPFERELEGIRRFEPISRSHPSQVAIHQVGQNTAEGYFYYVMDLADDAAAADGERTTDDRGQRAEVRGQRSPRDLRPSSPEPPAPHFLSCEAYVPRTLKHLLRARGRLPPAECLDIALSLTTALEHLHGHGLVHRDIKPSNVVFVAGVPKLADIGLVTSLDATQSFVGTEGFFPPEGPGTVQADLFSLGRLLYELVTGKDRREFPELPTGLPSADEAALSELNAVILKACQHDPALRYASASALREDLERLRQGRSVKRRRAWQRRWSRVRPLALPVAVGAAWVWALVIALRPHTEPGPADRRGTDPVLAGAATAVGGVPVGLNPRGVFVLPFRPADSNGAPADLCSRITDAFIDSLGLLTNQGISVGPRKSGWIQLPEAELFRRATNVSNLRFALTGRVATDVRRLSLERELPPASDQSLVTSAATNLTVAADVRRLASEPVFELSLTLQDLETGQPCWAESFTGPTNALIELEQRALARLLETQQVKPTPDQTVRIAQLLTNNLVALSWVRQAWAVYLRQGGTHVGYAEVQNLAQRALDSDAGYLEAHYCLGYMWRNLSQDLAPVQVWPAMMERMRYILSQDDTYSAALDHMAGYAIVFQRDWEGAVPFLERLFQTVPPAPFSRSFYRAFWLRNFGHFEAARREQAKAEEPEPVDGDQRYFMGTSRWLAREYAEGARVARRTLELLPDHAEGHFILAHCLVGMGDYSNAMQAIHDAQRVWKKQEMTALLGFSYARMGQPQKAREVLRSLEESENSRYLQPYFVARVHAALGDIDETLQWLEKAERDRTEYLFFPDVGGLRTDYAWDTLQNEPRYWQLCDRLGLGKDQWPRRVDLP